MPVLDFLFALLPAPEYFLAIELAVKIHQSLLESFEHAADLLELAEVVVDPARHLVDAAAQPHLLCRLAPFRPRLRGHQLVLVHQVAPFGMQRHQIGDDALHERQRAIGFGEGKIFAGHGIKIDGETGRRRAAVRMERVVRPICRLNPPARSPSTRPPVCPGPLSVYSLTITIPCMNSGCGMNPTTRLSWLITTIVERMCVSFSSSCSILKPSSSVSGLTRMVSVRAWSSAWQSVGSCPAATHCVTMSRSEIVPR